MSETVVWILNPMHSQVHQFPKKVSVDVNYLNGNYKCCVKYILHEDEFYKEKKVLHYNKNELDR